MNARRRFSPLLVTLCLVARLGHANPPMRPSPQAEDAVALTREAIRLHAAGRYREALPLAERALQLREATLGPNHPEVAVGLSNLSVLYRALGQYERGVTAAERAVRIWEAALGPEHPNLASGLINLVGALTSAGRYDGAVPLLERALRIREAALGPVHPDVAHALNNLAEVLRVLGQDERALPLHERALRIREEVLGAEHPDVAQSVSNLAEMHRLAGRFDQALAMHERALRIREATRGPTHPDVARSLLNVATLLFDMGRFADAAPRYERALHLWEALVGPEQAETTICINGLANVFHATGRYEDAARLYERALRIRESLYGPNHTEVGLSLSNLAATLISLRQVERALPLLDRVLHIYAGDIQRTASFLSADGLRQFLVRLKAGAGYLTSFALAHPEEPRGRALALQAALLLEARSEGEAVAALASVRRSRDPQDQALVAEWAAMRGRAAALGASRASAAERVRLDEASRAIEERLARRSAALRERYELTDVDALLGRVAARLAPDAALVELVAFQPVDLYPRGGPIRPRPARYAAFVLHPDGTHAMADLGETPSLDALAGALTGVVSSARRPIDAVTRAGAALEQRLFAPITPMLHAGVRRLVIAPDGPLHLAPLHLMHDGRAWLLDRYTVSYVTSGRDLLRTRSPQDVPSAPTAIVASRYRAPAWNLPGLDVQARLLPRLVPGIRLIAGDGATEGALRDVAAPLVLHVGAHGDFVDEAAAPWMPAMQRGGLLLADAAATEATRDGEHPAVALRDDGRDGFANAAELLTTNLRGTRLVVLSACETARGTSAPGEGVFGLRRALLLAGAEALVATQWNVDERAGAMFTVALYEGLRAGLRSADAVARAVRLVRQREPDPFAWAPFVLIGRDDTIDWESAPGAAQGASPARSGP